MARFASSSSPNPSVPVDEDRAGQCDGGDEDYGGICAEGGAEMLAEEGRAGGEGSGTEGARDSSGNSSNGSSHGSAADDDRGLRGLLRHCRPRSRRASNTRADESIASGAEGEEGKATAAGAPLKRSLTADAKGKSMARDAFNSSTAESLARSASDVLQDVAMDEMDREVLQEAFARVVALQQRVQHYRDLGGFVVLMTLFITILYLQADSSRSYEITAAHAVLFPPGMQQDASNTFAGPDDLYSWLNTSIVQSLWMDPTCGDGSCHRPFQFPAFGRFGCEADCGTFPNLTSVVVSFSSHLDMHQAEDESSWNLCMVNPVSLCWYESFQPFPRGDAEVSVAVDIPDGDWVVVLNAPTGGIRGTVHAPPPGTRRFSVVGAASTIELAAWGYCTHDDDVDAANQAQPSGGAAGSAPDICRDTCERLVACLPATCGRAFTEREVAGAFVDCARMCIVAPSSITTYAGFTCPMSDIATLFSKTPCNVSVNATAHISHLARRKAQSHHRLLHAHRYSDWTSAAMPAADAAMPAADAALPAADAALPAADAALPAPPVLGIPGTAVESPPLQTPPASLPPPPPAPAAIMAAAAIAAVGTAAMAADPTQPSLWSLLGATDRQRLTALQVAVSRALFTMAKDRCLAGRAPGAEARQVAGESKHTLKGPGSVRWRIVACLCTMLGGPTTTLDECRFTDEAGEQVVVDGDMYAYLQRTHVSGGRVISAQHMRRFVQTMVAALRSVTPMADAAAARLYTLMHSFDDAIVTSDTVGCSQAWLPWRAGVKHNTTIHVGDKVTWVWDDDLPHSLRGTPLS
ncbi:unnamed protein product [Closterium sp. NIES-64]|nr:unnamed protein product [Closterium sp. NIES-64]